MVNSDNVKVKIFVVDYDVLMTVFCKHSKIMTVRQKTAVFCTVVQRLIQRHNLWHFSLSVTVTSLSK